VVSRSIEKMIQTSFKSLNFNGGVTLLIDGYNTLCFTDVVLGFENDSYTIVEGDSAEICVVVKEPQNATINFMIPTMITAQDGTAIG